MIIILATLRRDQDELLSELGNQIIIIFMGDEKSEHQYFYLMEKVGTKGKYQWILFAVTILIFFCSNFQSSVAFYFLNPDFDCSTIDPTLSSEQCENYVCTEVS